MKYSFLGNRKRCNYSTNLNLVLELETFNIIQIILSCSLVIRKYIQLKPRMKYPNCPSLTVPGKARCFLFYACVTLFLHNDQDKRRKGFGVDWHIGNIISRCKLSLSFFVLLAPFPAQRKVLHAPQDTKRLPSTSSELG